MTDQLSPSDLKQLWGALEDITYVLTEIGAWLPEGRYREGIERALGALVPVEWAIVNRLGSPSPIRSQPAVPPRSPRLAIRPAERRDMAISHVRGVHLRRSAPGPAAPGARPWSRNGCFRPILSQAALIPEMVTYDVTPVNSCVVVR